ncbi:MAG: glycosyl transferase family 1 [Candidatus Altiarchaeales archaeon ex4484_43]|nr:MAG: glycosyl transferase family 1 [Candidatus Altiarchaeales archaeon ex4484_43]
MRSKNLLIISTAFPDKLNEHIGNIFIKGQINYLKNYFEKVYVISLIPIWRELLLRYHFRNYNWNNVQVHYLLYVYPPPSYTPICMKRLWLYIVKKAVDRLIRSEKINFNVIHAHYTWPCGAIGVELKKEFDVPVIITEHTSLTLYKAFKKRDPHYLKAWKKCDAIIRVNKKDIPLLKKFNENVTNIPNGFDGKMFYPLNMIDCREKLNLPVDKKIILTIGMLDKVKGHQYLISAMNEILKHRQDIACYIIGNGKLKDKLKKQIKTLDLSEYIHLVGGKPHEEIPLWMNACDLFVLPSLSEGNPTVMFECLGCGKPFIGTKVGGIPEIITSEGYGFLVEPKNSKNLAEKILIALDKKWDEKKILNYAKQFTWEEIAKDIIKVYGIK